MATCASCGKENPDGFTFCGFCSAPLSTPPSASVQEETGEGRCLAALGDAGAEAPLREARELFASMGYEPALAETEALLGDSEAAAV